MRSNDGTGTKSEERYSVVLSGLVVIDDAVTVNIAVAKYCRIGSAGRHSTFKLSP